MKMSKTLVLGMALATGLSGLAEYSDELITTSDTTVRRLLNGTECIYIFTNAAVGEVAVSLKQAATLKRVLVAGGGGAGGWTIAGGGGAGHLIQQSPDAEFAADDTLTLTVGAGGDPKASAAGSTWPRGGNGRTTTLAWGETTLTAQGGTGGDGWGGGISPGEGTYGSGGGACNSRTGVTFKNVTYLGYAGGTSSSECPGGGGGAGGAGGNGSGGQAGRGGLGVDSDITGTLVNYCAGGSGGCGNSCSTVNEPGGASGGKGGAKGSGKKGGSAPDGFGGGGGGGSYSPGTCGGAGGAGTVILRFSSTAFGSVFTIDAGNPACTPVFDPQPGTYLPLQGESVTATATSATNAAAGLRSLLTGYRLEVGTAAPETHTGNSYTFTADGTTAARVTWLWDEQALQAYADGARSAFLAGWCAAGATLDPDTAAAYDPSLDTVYNNLFLTNGYTFAASETPLKLGAGGLRAPDASAATTYTVGMPLQVTAAQTWYLGTNTTTDLQKPLAVNAPLTIGGRGTLNLRQPGTGSAKVTVTGCTDPDAYKRAGAATRIYAYTNDVFGAGLTEVDTYHAQLLFVGDFTQTANLLTRCSKNDWDYHLHFKGNIVFNGTYQHTGANMRPVFYRGRTVVFNNTFTTASSMYNESWGTFSTTEYADVIFNKKLSVGDRFNMPSSLRFTLNVATNRINGNKGTVFGIIRCGCARALEFQNGNGNGTFFYPGTDGQKTGTLDMNGFDQGLGCIYSLGNAGLITSATPATLHLVDNYKVANYDSGQYVGGTQISVFGYTNYAVFAGCASLSKEGQYTNRLKRVSTTYGDLSVSKGRLEFAPEATWLNASNLTVKATGLFTLDNRTSAQGQPFGRQLDVWVEGAAAKVELNNTTPVVVRYFTIDGARQDEYRYYGSAAAAAAHPELNVAVRSCFTGEGVLFSRGIPGLMVFIR